jgi:polyhydroxyalkanoate synthesis regulator phasin
MTNDEMLSQMADMLEAQTVKMTVFIENTITKRLDSLYDGYMLTNEKQWALIQKMEALEDRIARLESQAS